VDYGCQLRKFSSKLSTQYWELLNLLRPRCTDVSLVNGFQALIGSLT
jgi:hypothetical protein